MTAEGVVLRDVMVYLGAAVVCVPLAQRLGLGSVLGYLIAGCAIGPWGTGLVGNAAAALQFAEFGVVLMLFVIGLELDGKRLLAMRIPVFGGGGLQMAACGAVLAAALALRGLDWRVALLVGVALAMSSTAIAVQTMTERNLLAAPLGRASFAVLLFQDIAAIPLIALVPLIGTGGTGATPGWQVAAKGIVAICAVIAIGRYLTRPVMRVVAASHVREIFTAFTLLLVVGIAELMTAAGLSMALGAFLAGVLLASSEYRHALEADIAPFKGLLLGLFFIAVGMSIDFSTVVEAPLQLAMLLGLLLGLKAIVLALIAPRLGIDPKQRWLFAALLAQSGEFAFVVLAAARQSGALDARWEATLSAAVALSMAATPLLLLLLDRIDVRRARIQAEAEPADPGRAPIVIAGFGRYGQIVARMLLALEQQVTVLDHSPEQIEIGRRFGYKVFYGDATRLDLLEAAGIAEARLLVVAIDDVEDSLALVDLARSHWPQLQIVARARNVRHWLELAERGIRSVERETFESALRSGRAALEAIGFAPYEAREYADLFRRRNLATLRAMLPHFRDRTKAVAIAKSGSRELEESLRSDRDQKGRPAGPSGWE